TRREERSETTRVTRRPPHRLHPPVGYRHQRWVERGPQLGHPRRQGMGEVLVLATSVAVPGHHHPRTEARRLLVEIGQRLALLGREESREHREPGRVQRLERFLRDGGSG